jgi:hypothetical protein
MGLGSAILQLCNKWPISEPVSSASAPAIASSWLCVRVAALTLYPYENPAVRKFCGSNFSPTAVFSL